MNEGWYGHRLSLYKFTSMLYGRGGDIEGKASFRDFDKQHTLQPTSWKNLFCFIQAIVVLGFLSLVYTSNSWQSSGCGKKVIMQEIKAFRKG